MSITDSGSSRRWLIFGVWAALTLLAFWKPVYEIVQLALHDETSSHILLIPFISGWLIYTAQKQTKPVGSLNLLPAVVFLLPGLLLTIFALQCSSCTSKTRLSAYALAIILVLIAGFILILGAARARASSFGLAFLLFCIPIPDSVLNRVIYWLQSGSAAIAEVFFNLSGAPVLREGFVFRLPKYSIEVARECSGIRSSLALLILALLVAHSSFRPLWKKLVFVLAGLCMMLIKNGIRITSLTLLANYVNPGFLFGRLHHQGGIIFFLIGLALLVPVFWLLRKGETSTAEQPLRVAER